MSVEYTKSPPKSVDTVRSEKLAQISEACNAAIDAGTEVQLASGEKERFSYTLEDQANISEMFTACMAGATGYIYHANNGPCRTYSAADIVSIYGTLSMYKTGQTTYHNQIKQLVNSLDTKADIQAVVYGQPLTDGYLEQYNILMAEAKTQLDAVLAAITQRMSAG